MTLLFENVRLATIHPIQRFLSTVALYSLSLSPSVPVQVSVTTPSSPLPLPSPSHVTPSSTTLDPTYPLPLVRTHPFPFLPFGYAVLLDVCRATR